jgi:hypothetical protein
MYDNMIIIVYIRQLKRFVRTSNGGSFVGRVFLAAVLIRVEFRGKNAHSQHCVADHRSTVFDEP